jgi:septal ring factor EnvC (AmiA/AmiB activator)
MTDPTKLPPMPAVFGVITHPMYDADYMREYARLAVEQATAEWKADLRSADEIIRHLQEELAQARAELARLRSTVDEQAEDDGLWFVAKTAPEAYLQSALRDLHTEIESLPLPPVKEADK